MKTILKRISAGALAAVFLATFAVPRTKAVTGVDDTTLGIMAVIVHLQSIGGELAVTQGTALATTDAVTSLATQAGAAGALGAGVTGATALATIGAAVTAAAGGFTIGYVGYQTLQKLAEWIRQSKLTGTAENKIWIAGGSGGILANGRNIAVALGGPWDFEFGQVYSTQLGSSFWINYSEDLPNKTHTLTLTTISSTNLVQTIENVYERSLSIGDLHYDITVRAPYEDTGHGWVTIHCNEGYKSFPVEYSKEPIFKDVFTPAPSGEEKQEVTYAPPAMWSPPAPSLGQDVLYQPYPNQPDKPLTDIAQDVPKDIFDKQLKPLPPTVVTPTTPPVTPPDIPPVNPNPDVETPDDVTPYKVKIGEVFPFCIPFDVYHMVTMFSAEPEAPHAKWTFSLPWSPAQEYKVEWDLKKFDELAELCRKLELVLFCVGLAVVTSKLIKW